MPVKVNGIINAILGSHKSLTVEGTGVGEGAGRARGGWPTGVE